MGERVLIGTIVYGAYVDIFEKVCLRSLFQPGNIPFLIEAGYQVEYTIYTRQDGEIDRLKEIARDNSRDGLEIKLEVIQNGNNYELLRKYISNGINVKSLFLNPDFFFGDGSLRNIIAYQFKNNMCLAALHVRVDYDKFQDRITAIGGNISNPQLVTIAMNCLHKSWGESFASESTNNCNASGSTTQQLTANLWAVTFRIPTIFLTNFTQPDISAISAFDHWDHVWPTKLMEDHRFKFIGSSDVFFAVELTKADNNIPAVQHNMQWNDNFHANTHHSEVNRNFLAIVRGDSG